MEIERVNRRVEAAGNYFTQPAAGITFSNTGCKTLDLALGGGWACDRVINVIGDKSSGKTLLAIEGGANFIFQFPDGLVEYREGEGAFDLEYARALGMPLDRVNYAPIETVEDLF